MNELILSLVRPCIALCQLVVGRIKASLSFITACVALLVALALMSAQADFITADSLTVTGDEDTTIPLGLTADEAFFTGGSQMDIIGTHISFVDAFDASKQVVVPIPSGTQFIRVTGVGGNDNASNSSREEEFLSLRALVKLANATYSGSIVANSDDTADSI